MADYNHGPNRFNSTPRKVFDKHVDRVEAKRQRDREDHRADMQAIIQKMIQLENQLLELHDHVAHHCRQLGTEDIEPLTSSGSEGLE